MRIPRRLEPLALRVLCPPFPFVWVVARVPPFRRDEIVLYVETGSSNVALTLDDGPKGQLTRDVVEILGDRARATFFFLGEEADRDQDVLALIRSRGHEIGNHTWRDEGSATLRIDDFVDRLAKTHGVLTERGGEVRVFRPGGGLPIRRGDLAEIARREHGYTCVLASVYPHDVRIWSEDAIVAAVLRRVRKGSIIALHEGTAKDDQPRRDRIVGMLERIVPALMAKGYELVTVSELIAQGRPR
jgi:peptidoglycan/xylan/chitin deacetylase (PgdA/CDA1 family)